MSFRYRIVQKDGREYHVSSDLSRRDMIAQEKKVGLLKEMYLSLGTPTDEKDAQEKWEKVYPEPAHRGWY
jgi:hypothetical protein